MGHHTGGKWFIHDPKYLNLKTRGSHYEIRNS